MRHPRVRPFPLALVSLAALTAALTAQGTPIGFEERWALADDRAALVTTLAQGSSDWHYWHCRERLDARDFATVRRLLAEWQTRHGELGRHLDRRGAGELHDRPAGARRPHPPLPVIAARRRQPPRAPIVSSA